MECYSSENSLRVVNFNAYDYVAELSPYKEDATTVQMQALLEGLLLLLCG